MAIRGSLADVSLSSVVTLCCREKKQSRLRILYNGQEAVLFFKDGYIIHMALDSREGGELIHELLTWKDGIFDIEHEVVSPKLTIAANQQVLLLEGLHQIAEDADKQADGEEIDRGCQPILALSSTASEDVGQLLCHLLSSVGGRFVVITDRGGRLIHWQGGIDKSQAISLAALISGSFSATAEIAEALRKEGESRQFRQSLQEGGSFSMFSVLIGERSILSLCFNSNGNVPLGLVRFCTLKAANEIDDVLKNDVTPEANGPVIKDVLQDVEGALNDMFGD